MTTFEFTVEMTCSGCSTAVTKLLTRQKEKGEIQDFEVDLPTKKVSVTTVKELAEVQAILEKSGKKVVHVNTLVAA